MKLTEKERNFVEKFFSMERTPKGCECDFGYDIDVHWDYIYSIQEFAALKTLHQSPKWHSESEYVSGHVERVVDACKNWLKYSRNLSESFVVELMLSAIFHDIGKVRTTFFKEKDGMWHHYGHEIESEKITRRILWDLGYNLREHVCCLVRWHMEPMNIVKSKDTMFKIVELRIKGCNLRQLYLLKKFDMEGSTPADPELTKFDLDILHEFYKLCIPFTDNWYFNFNDIKGTKRNIANMINAKQKHIDVEMYIGLPGAGKDTAIAASMKDGKERVVICRDDIRVELGYCKDGEKYLGTNDEENKVTEVFNRKLKEAAESGKVVVINNMNNKRKYRDAYKQMLKDYNVTWKYIYVEASELSKNIERRKGQIQESVFKNIVENFEFPTFDEFDSFNVISNGQE